MAKQEQRTAGNPRIPEMPEHVTTERVANYEVFDAEDKHIGSTTAIWMDENNQPAFIGVKTTWLMGKTHVIPAWGAEVNHQTEKIRLPCSGDIVRDAPSFSPDESLDEPKECRISDYFQSKGACQAAYPRGNGRPRRGANLG